MPVDAMTTNSPPGWSTEAREVLTVLAVFLTAMAVGPLVVWAIGVFGFGFSAR